jgi:parallel beta-helix repeat protein
MSTIATVSKLGATGAYMVGTPAEAEGSVTRPLSDRLLESESIKNFGAVGDGVTDDTQAIRHAVASGGHVFIPVGTYRVTGTITLPSDICIWGVGRSSLIKADMTGFSVFYANTESDITVDSVGFLGTTNNVGAVRVDGCSRVRVVSCVVEGIRLFYSSTGGSTHTYAAATDDLLSSDLIVNDNVCVGAGRTSALGQEPCIYFTYAKRCSAKGNKVRNYRHGIGWWGGDANTNGTAVATRWTKDVTITGNTVSAVGVATDNVGGGIFGSMGERIAVTGNTVSDCGDVGIDAEGTYYVSISGNTVSDCRNGCITTFFRCRGVSITGNSTYQTGAGFKHIYIFNSTQEATNRDFVITGNVCENIDGVGTAGGQTSYSLLLSGNVFKNVKIDRMANNSTYMKVSGNILTFDTASTATVSVVGVVATDVFTAIDHGLVIGDAMTFTGTGGGVVVGTVYYVVATTTNTFQISDTRGGAAFDVVDTTANVATLAMHAIDAGGNHGGRLDISGNIVRSSVAQPADSRGIYATQTDPTSTPVTFISDNLVSGFTTDIEVLANSSNAGLSPIFNISRNTFGAGVFVRSEGATAMSTVRLIDNITTNGDPYPAATPVAGKWDTGQKIYNAPPVSGAFIGAVCTAGGSPGTWKGFGAIA